MSAPKPIPSPGPPDPGPEEPSKVTRLRKQTEWLRNLFLSGLALLVGAGGGLVWKVFDKFDLVNTATAQTAAKADTALESSKSNTTRIEAVDAGVRVEIATMRKELSEARDDTKKQLTDLQLTLNAFIREQRAAKK